MGRPPNLNLNLKVAELRTVLRGRKGANEMRRTLPLNLWNL